MLERFFSSLFFCVVIFDSVLVQCCSVLFRVLEGSLLSSESALFKFFPSCLSLVTPLIF